MAMASLASFIPRRPPSPLRFLSPRPPARRCCFLGLLQLLRRYSSSSCQYPPEVVPSTAGACQEGDAEQGKEAPANAQDKGVAAAARRRPAAPKGRPGAPRESGSERTTKPKQVGPTPPGNPKEGTGGNRGVIHVVPDVAPSSSSSSSSSSS